MTHPRYRTLLGATLAALFIGAAIAQTTSDDPSRLPANKGTPQAEQTQPADQPTDKKVSAAVGMEASAAKTTKPAKQASRARNQTTAALDPNEKAFRDALRQCAKEQRQSQRDSCVDSAIEQFQRG